MNRIKPSSPLRLDASMPYASMPSSHPSPSVNAAARFTGTHRRKAASLLGLLALINLAACAHHRPAPVPWQGSEAALQTLSQRGAALHTLRAACGLTLASKSDSVTLDGALAVRVSPDASVWLRLRTWKIAATVFDLTVRPDGVWVTASDEATKRNPSGVAALKPEQLSQGWSLFMGGFFAQPNAEIVEDSAAVFSVRRRMDDGTHITARVDKSTLNPLDYTVTDTSGVVRQTITLSRYAQIGPDKLPIPMRITAAGPDGTIEVRLEDAEVNGEIEDAVFVPPPRAVRQP